LNRRGDEEKEIMMLIKNRKQNKNENESLSEHSFFLVLPVQKFGKYP
jgi:hypothetical protein